jgi:hypothetical protein
MEMMEGARQLSLALGGSGSRPLEARKEMRERTVRRVEYAPFPRVGSDTRTRVGFTRDASASGMALGVEEALPAGSLVRIIVQRVDGRPDFDAVARVAWCRQAPGAPTGSPAAWLGLALVAEVRRGMARIPSATAPVQRAGLA